MKNLHKTLQLFDVCKGSLLHIKWRPRVNQALISQSIGHLEQVFVLNRTFQPAGLPQLVLYIKQYSKFLFPIYFLLFNLSDCILAEEGLRPKCSIEYENVFLLCWCSINSCSTLRTVFESLVFVHYYMFDNISYHENFPTYRTYLL